MSGGKEHSREAIDGTFADGEGLRRLSRRAFLGAVAGAGAAVGVGGVLSAYGPAAGAASLRNDSNPASTKKGLKALPGGKPKRGGTFTVGVLSFGSEENLFPGTATPTPDCIRDYALYNLLFYPSRGERLFPIQPGLALSAESNKSATVWTIKLRDGVTWHDGKPFTAADVVYNIVTLWNDPAQNYSSSFLTGLVDYKNVKAMDNLTVQIPLVKPSAQFPSIFAWFNFGILQEGATAKSTAEHPIGTGPFMYESFTPGVRSVFVRNPNYWESGKPYVDTLITDSSFTTNNSMLDAILSGQINLYCYPTLAQAREQLAKRQVQVLESESASNTYAFGMRVDTGPFADNNIRKALKLLVTRQAMVDGSFSGFGHVGNDLQGPNTQYFAYDLKSEYDPDKAKYLFKKAGVLGKTFVFPTCDAAPGMITSSEIWQEQCKAAGITLKLKVQPAGPYYTSADGAYVRPIGYQVAQALASLTGQYRSLIQTGAPYWTTHWGQQKPGGKQATELILSAESALSTSTANRLWAHVQEEQFTEGGYLVWGWLPYIDFAANNVRGLGTSSAFNFGTFRFQDGWLD